jgi:hypothetical protein
VAWPLWAIAVLVLTSSLAFGVDVASAAQLTLQWVDNDGTSTFKVERKTGTGGSYAQIATTATGATGYTDTSVAVNTTYCYRVKASNAAGDSAYSNESCNSAAGTFDVTVAKAGTGAGTVLSSPTGINCGSDCYESFTAGTVVTLNATPASGSAFAGWSGGGCSGTAACTTSGNTAVTITANFSSSSSTPSYTLDVRKSGTGSGTVTSAPSGIWCGSDCAQAYPSGTTITLTATPSSGSTFSGWSGGGCSGTGSCTVRLSANTIVTAAFAGSTATQTYTVWPASAVPQTASFADGRPVTLGMKFRSDVPGSVIGIRFYKGSMNTGTHVGSLWTESGRLLAALRFTSETASGWQEARFDAPVAISANTTYVVSYHTTVGYYAVDPGYFTYRGVDTPPLHAPSSGSVSGNGVYRYGATNAFPYRTYNGSNYWVDVLFRR